MPNTCGSWMQILYDSLQNNKTVPNKVTTFSNKDSIKEDTIPVTHSISSPAKAYGKEQPKSSNVPKRIREINEDLTFEKIRRTGTRKIPTPSTTDAADGEKTSASNKEGIEEDMKELDENISEKIQKALENPLANMRKN